MTFGLWIGNHSLAMNWDRKQKLSARKKSSLYDPRSLSPVLKIPASKTHCFDLYQHSMSPFPFLKLHFLFVTSLIFLDQSYQKFGYYISLSRELFLFCWSSPFVFYFKSFLLLFENNFYCIFFGFILLWCNFLIWAPSSFSFCFSFSLPALSVCIPLNITFASSWKILLSFR